MAQECRKILDEMTEEQFAFFSFETGFELIEFFENFDENNDEYPTKLGHMISQCAQFLRATSNRKTRRICKRLFLAMAEMGNAEDTLLDFLEEIEFEEEADFQEVIVLLECVKKCLLRLPLTDHHPVTWCFSSIVSHINCQIELPQEHNLEGQEKLLLDSDLDVINIDNLYSKLILFVQFIFNEVIPNFKISKSSHDEFTDNLIIFLLKLLGKPMAYMDLELYDNVNSKNSFRSYCETIIEYLYSLKSDLFRYIDSADNKSESGDDVIFCDFSYLSLGVFYYLLIKEGIYLDKLPQVYDSIYIFKCLLEHSLVMVEISSNLVQRKGLLLCSSWLNHISEYQLKISNVNSSTFSRFIQALPGIMVYSENNENRQAAIELFKKLLYCLDSNSRYIVLLNITKFCNHSGFVGYVTTVVKNIVAGYLSTKNNTDEIYFSKKRLNDILKIFTKLPQGVETDIAENSDGIISALNFIRYLTLRDKDNVTGVWDSITWIKEDFLYPLKKAIELSKAHYELEMKNSLNEEPDAPVSITVGGQTLPNLTVGEKQKVLHNAINTFDLIDSIRVRVLECIENP